MEKWKTCFKFMIKKCKLNVVIIVLGIHINRHLRVDIIGYII